MAQGTQSSENQDDLPPSPAPGDPPSTPPTDQPEDGHTDNGEGRRLSTLENLIREQNRQIQEQRQELERIRTTRETPAPPPVNPEEERAAWYNDPKGETRKVLQEALKETIEPLTQFVREFKATSRVGKFITNVKSDPRFSAVWDSDVEDYVESALNNAAQQNIEITDTIAIQAAVQAIGMKQIGALGNGSSAPRTRNDNPPTDRSNDQPPRSDRSMPPTPPHLRPTAPTGPRSDNGAPKTRPLTEAEKRLARENRMTDAEYLAWLEAPATDVAFSDVGKPKPAGGR